MSIVKMARAIFHKKHPNGDPDGLRIHFVRYGVEHMQANWQRYSDEASAAITATGLTEAQLEGLANGTHVVVPVEPTEAMKQAFQWGSVLPGEIGAGTNAEVWRAMLAAKEG